MDELFTPYAATAELSRR